MVSNALASVLRLLLLLGLAICVFPHGRSFAKLRQETSASFRERSGGELREKVTEFIKLNPDESRLLSKISAAGGRREWSAVCSAFASYAGDAIPIYTATLYAAVRCQEYREGAKIFEQGQQRCAFMNAPMYTQALKIFGKLKDVAKVDELWCEALEVCKLDEFLASARIAAAADQGDIKGAAAILDQVNESGLPLTPVLINSAIRSCWNSSKFSDKAARYFYDLFGQCGVAPTVVTFGALAGALRSAPLEDMLWTYDEMKARQIVPNRVFAETFVASLLGVLNTDRDPERLAQEKLRYKTPERLEAARRALNDFQSQGVELSGLCRNVGKALSKLGF